MTVREYLKQNKTDKEISILTLDENWELTSIKCKDCMDEEIQEIEESDNWIELWIINKTTEGEC